MKVETKSPKIAPRQVPRHFQYFALRLLQSESFYATLQAHRFGSDRLMVGKENIKLS
jgi:hypothetical protein